MMRIAATSDLHGYLPPLDATVDIILIAGDISPLHIQRNIQAMRSWIERQFIPWAQELPAEKVFLVAGNHDFFFEKTTLQELALLFAGTKTLWRMGFYAG